MVIGNLGTDVEMKYTPSGNAVTSFRLAVSRSYKDSDGEKHDDTEWFSVVCWNKLAESCNQYLAKGKRAYIEGRLKSQTWTSQDGQTRFKNEIIANSVIFLDRKSETEGDGKDSGADKDSEGESGKPFGW